MRFISLVSFGLLWFNTVFAGAVTQRSVADGDLYIISIGINDYSETYLKTIYKGCEDDALRVHRMFSEDYLELTPSADKDHGIIHPFLLLGQNADYEGIKSVFKTVARQAKEEDNVVLFFAGVSESFDDGSAALIPFHKKDSLSDSSIYISMPQLASWMENIQANNQLIITEAGMGKNFAYDLINNVFERHPMIASEYNRNRIVLTTNGMGWEGRPCSDWFGGYLVKFLSNANSLFKCFSNTDLFEYDLIEQEMICSRTTHFNGVYTRVFKESDYRWLLLRQSHMNPMRGAVINKLEPDSSTEKSVSKNYALVISTNNYSSSYWSALRNPKNDADEIAEVLQERYGFEIIRLHDKPQDTVLLAIKTLKRELQPQDKVFVFVAGHGIFDEDHADGFLVFRDALSLEEDPNYHSYLQMAKLNTMINSLPAKQVFLVFDVCFGSSFDLSAEDLKLSDYRNLQLDGSLESFIENKDTSYYSRIYLASGKAAVPDYWSNSLDHSPFASKLIYALKQEDQFFSPGKLFLYLEGNITEPVLKHFGKHEARGDFLIKVASAH